MLLTTATAENYEAGIEITTDKGNKAGLILYYNEKAFAGLLSAGKGKAWFQQFRYKNTVRYNALNKFSNLLKSNKQSMGKMMNLKAIVFFTLIFLYSCTFCSAEIITSTTTTSPGKNTRVLFSVEQGVLQYRMYYLNEPVTEWSVLGLLADTPSANEKTTINSKAVSSNKSSFKWALGEDDVITNNYSEIKLSCSRGQIHFNIIARVYDGCVAFRYEIPKQSSNRLQLKKEETEFRFPETYTIYQYNQESVFTPVSIDTFTKSCDFPATLTNGKWYISIGEAANTGYTKSELKTGVHPHSLTTVFPRDSSVNVDRLFQSPWRTISVAKSAIGLHDYSQLYLKLNPPPVKGIPTWIKPGKLIRSQLNTQSGLDCIDFAAKHDFQYIMFDAGWYGAEFRSSSDPTQVIPQIDMQRVIQAGKEKGIGVILYVNYVGLKAKLDTLIPLFKKWGVAGMKFGFVDGLTQSGLTWLAEAIRKVNDAGFILDIHDNYKPTGLSRTYSVLLTQEGIRGDENSPDAFHTTTLPFTRFLAGPADFTFCYPNAKNRFTKNLKVSMGQQLALTVVYFSPLQSIFWYGQPNDYTNESEIEFFKYVPTVWNESHYLAGDIGKGISVARRNGTTWFMGNAAGLEDWNATVLLDFLQKGKKYRATIYEDDGKESIIKSEMDFTSGQSFQIQLKAKEGQAIIFRQIK